MFNLLEITAKQEQYQELLRQAEQERSLRKAFGHKQHTGLSRTVSWLWALLLLRTG